MSGLNYKAVDAAMGQNAAEYNQGLDSQENGFLMPGQQLSHPVSDAGNKAPTACQRDPEGNSNFQTSMDPSQNIGVSASAPAMMSPGINSSVTSPNASNDHSLGLGGTKVAVPNPALNALNLGHSADVSLQQRMDTTLNSSHQQQVDPSRGMNNMVAYDQEGLAEGEVVEHPPQNLFDTKSSNPILVRGSWQWMCNQCPKSYTSKSNLIAHLLDHCGIKPHMCMACGKSFKQVAHLNTHRVIHTGRRKHVCPICGRGFNQRVHLKRHMVTHNINVACTCELCGRKFAFPSELQFHHKKVHRKRSGPPKKNKMASNDVENFQHFNASADMNAMMASQGQSMGPYPPPRINRQMYPPIGKRRGKAKRAHNLPSQMPYGSMPSGHPMRRPSNDHLPMSPDHMTGAGDQLPFRTNQMSPRTGHTSPRNNQMSPRSERTLSKDEFNKQFPQGGEQGSMRQDQTSLRSDQISPRQEGTPSKNNQISPRSEHFRQSYDHEPGPSQSPRGAEQGHHDDGLLPAELFQPELVHPDAGKSAVFQPEAMETLRFQPRSHPVGQRPRRGPHQMQVRGSSKKKGAPLKPELTCHECGRQFAFPFELRDHLARHRDVRPYVCTECGHQFFKEHHLKQHQLIHTGLKPYKCHICDRAFALKANMMRHTKLHVNNRQFKCQVCDKSFTQKQTLSNHMVIHKDEKPFSCTMCGKKFSRKVNLDSHVYLHFGNKPFKCSICGSKYNNKGNLKRHVKNKHGMDADLISDGEREENEGEEVAGGSQQDLGKEMADEEPGKVESPEAEDDGEEEEEDEDEENEDNTGEQSNDNDNNSDEGGEEPTTSQQVYEDNQVVSDVTLEDTQSTSVQKEFEEQQNVRNSQSYEHSQASNNQQTYASQCAVNQGSLEHADHPVSHTRPVSQSSFEGPEHSVGLQRPISQGSFESPEQSVNLQRPVSQGSFGTPSDHPGIQQRPISQPSYEDPVRTLSQHQHFHDRESALAHRDFVSQDPNRQQGYRDQEQPRNPEGFRNRTYLRQPSYPDHERSVIAENFRTPDLTHSQTTYQEHVQGLNPRAYVSRDIVRQPLYQDPGRAEGLAPYGTREPYPAFHGQPSYPRHPYHHVERLKIEQGEAMVPQSSLLMHPHMGMPM